MPGKVVLTKTAAIHRLHAVCAQLPWPLRGVLTRGVNSCYRRYQHWRTDAFLVSFPKSGRTWLRAMLGKYLVDLKDIEADNFLNVYHLTARLPGVPRILITHEQTEYKFHPSAATLRADRSHYRSKQVVLLVRDVRDTLVSYYMECTKRAHVYPGNISSFLRDDRFGAPLLVAYLNIWAANREVPRRFLLLRYEDLHRDPALEFTRLLEFLGIEVKPALVQSAVQHCSFANMKRLEQGNSLRDNRLSPGDPTDPESFKVRKGKVGGYRDYLAPEDLEYVAAMIRQLSPYYGYSAEGVAA